jgi:DNA mismatch endonuclease (patch repair protein)
MVDHLEPLARSKNMSAVRSKDTQPERIVRKLANGLGYRYRLHGARLPGRPDLVFPSRRKVIFVHGCFWHRHAGCERASTPKTRLAFWTAKFCSNSERDRRVERELEEMGWATMIIWQCELKDLDRLSNRLLEFLGNKA